jgi:hypothetical protein
MRLFKRQNQVLNPNLELGKIAIKSRLLDDALLLHLAAIIGTCGESGAPLQTDWPNDQRIAVHQSSIELAASLLSKSDVNSKTSATDYSIEIKQTVDHLTEKLALDSFEHPYQAPMVFALSELFRQKRSDFSNEQIADAVEVILTSIISIKWFPKWSEENSDSIKERLSFTNQGAIDRNELVISKVIMKEEIALNAGVSYMLNQGNMGDGTLIATNRRLIFVFDEDFKKAPQSFLLSNFKHCNFSETSVVPMSKELTIQFSDFGLDQSVGFYVGNFYSEELAKLFNTIN